MVISQSIKEAWEVNERMNKILLEYLTPEMLSVQTPDKNWSVAGYLAHMAGSKKWWGRHLDKEMNHLPNLSEEIEGNYKVEKDLVKIKDVFEQTSRVMLETAERADSKRNLPHASIDLYLMQMIIHDAHHRGQILLTLRTAGYAPPDEEAFWGGWWPEQSASTMPL